MDENGDPSYFSQGGKAWICLIWDQYADDVVIESNQVTDCTKRKDQKHENRFGTAQTRFSMYSVVPARARWKNKGITYEIYSVFCTVGRSHHCFPDSQNGRIVTPSFAGL